MDHIPSQSISKSILIVTPLFLLVLAVLHSSSQLSYLFILRFINNVAGSADITLLPTMQIQTTHQLFNKQLTLNQFKLYQSPQINPQNVKIPLIDIKAQQKWIAKNPIIKGSSPRWIIPTKIGTTDTLLIVMNVAKQKQIGMFNQNLIPSLDGKQIALDLLLTHKLGYELGDVVPVNFKIKNFLNGLKLFQKFQDVSSDNQYKPENQKKLQQQQLSNMTYQQLKPYIGNDVNQTQFAKIFTLLYDNQVNVQYTLKKSFYPQGMYPSAFTNVIIMETEGFTNLLSQWILEAILKVNEQEINVNQYLPKQYQKLWPKNQLQAQASVILSKSQFKKLFQNFALMSVVRLNNRQQIYKPHEGQKYQQFATMLQSVPGNMQVIVVYPFFRQSLAIKYFFDSVIQIFQFVTCIIYFYTMTLIMKQIYQEKQVQVGIWRTLGAGAVSQRKIIPLQVQLRQKSLQNKGSGLKYSSQFQQKMNIKQKLRFYSKLAVKVGYIHYWLATICVSIILYFFLKLIFYKIICTKLGVATIFQPLQNLPIIFILVFIFIQILIYQHIHRIYTNPLSQTIKPVKRTFDVVKVRIIHVATFGVSLQVLLIAIMLVYYGVVSYYWIPFAILDGQQDLQVLLFNTIFLFMIFGSIILLGILQSRIQIIVFNLIFRFNSQMRTMKLAILKNIKAKQYKNIKVAIIISIIFAFVLFFTAGIKIQMQIVQSFIQRALGSNLVFENYQKITFDNKKIQDYLDDKQVQYSWLSKGLSRDNISISLISHITGKNLKPQIQVLTPQYLNSTFYQYYYPENYLPESSDYWKLPNKVLDGFNSIYTGSNGQQSVGKYNNNDTIKQVDPYKINVQGNPIYIDTNIHMNNDIMSPQEQVIKMVVSSGLRQQLGVNIGDYYKMKLENNYQNKSYLIRAQLVHSFKAGPGFDIIGRKAFISQQQAAYIYKILGMDDGVSAQNEKLFIKGTAQALKPLGPTIITLSPQQTQIFQIDFVSQSFQLLSYYLNAYIVLITCIMSALVTIFIFLYTLGKCREQAEMYKMLRAIGLSAKNIRIMVFCQIIIRLIVALLGGIGLGVVFSIGFSLQIQQFLMIKTPLMDITIVSVIGICLIIILSFTIIRATKYISQRTVAETNKI